MHGFLRRYAEWRGRRRAAQVIVFDGGAEVERTRAFARGVVAGVVLAFVVVSLAAPAGVDPVLQEEAERRSLLVDEANARALQAAELAQTCIRTAQQMERTLASYRQLLEAER